MSSVNVPTIGAFLLLISSCWPAVDSTPSIVVRTRRQAEANHGSTVYRGDSSVRRSGKIAVGTPAKDFRVAFNMESSDLWLIHPNASINPGQYSSLPMQSAKVRYDSAQSSSAEPPQSSAEEFISDMGAAGTLEKDNITVAGVAIQPKVYFGAAITGIPKEFVFSNCYTTNCNFDVDGMFGLAPGNGSSNGGILSQLTEALTEPVVTIHTTGLANTDGTITFGGVDSENCEPSGYNFVPLAEPKDKWVANLVELRVGNVTVNGTGIKVEIIDKYELAYVPEAHFHAIGQALGAVLAEEHHLYYRFPKLQSDVILVIGEPGGQTTEIVLKYSQYIYQSQLLRFVAEKPSQSTNNDTWYITAPLMVGHCFGLNWQQGSIAVSTTKN